MNRSQAVQSLRSNSADSPFCPRLRGQAVKDSVGFMVGQFDARTIRRLSIALRTMWANLHAVGRSPNVAREAQNRIQQVIGSFSAMWAVLLTRNLRKFRGRADSTNALMDQLSRKGVRESLGAQVCSLLSMTASRRAAILDDAAKAKSPVEELSFVIAARILERHLWDILYTGILAELPNSLRVVSIDPIAVKRMASLLFKLHLDCTVIVQDLKLSKGSAMLVGQIAGVGLFEGIRAQEKGRVEDSLAALVSWYTRKSNRSLRGFYADLGKGIDELASIYQKLLIRKEKLSGKREKEALEFVLDAIRNGVFGIFETGILAAVAA